MLGFFDARQLAHAPLREMHNGSWTDYNETPLRAESVCRSVPGCLAAQDHGLGPIEAVHAGGYLAFLQSAWDLWSATGRTGDAIPYVWPVVGRREVPLLRVDALLGRYSFDAATPIGPATWESAYWSAQTALTAVQAVVDGARSAFALCRPPGHHAGADYFGGYCYLNNAAVAAEAAIRRGTGPVAVLDLDYHHGNGTQDIFVDRGDVGFVSIHADPATDYPFYWGHADERGAGAGAGATFNIPLARGSGPDVYFDALERALAEIRKWESRFLVVSFGADTFEEDPISHFRLRRETYPAIAARVAALALPTVVVMEGGYASDALGDNVGAFLAGFGTL